MTSRDGDDTIDDERLQRTIPRRRDGDVTHVRVIPPIAKYTLGPVLGRGGMGEVVLAHDREIGREIAIKRLPTAEPHPDDVRRFLREARIQALLDHPAIVPVHEVGEDEAGCPYFTMKRLVGTTLADLLAKHEPVQRLLRAFADVARAIERAHSLGVVHRDLKPANIMLGDFGEVYVIDWGLARVAGDPDDGGGAGASAGEGTLAGAMLGTPGYMSPEQAHDARAVGPETDVYALGAILFEILAGEPLHPRGQGALASTLSEIDPSPARRCSERAVPLELDALCCEALARDPSARPSARALAERVERYLDGDRDLARRRELAAEYLATARAELARDERALAMRWAGRALALDPTVAEAADLVTRLMLEPPASPPPALRAELDAMDAHAVRRHAGFSTLAYLSILVFVPLAAWNGIRNWPLVGTIVALSGGLAVLIRTIGRRGHAPSLWAYAVGNAVLLALIAALFGPLLVVPALAGAVVLGLVGYPYLLRRAPLVIAMCLCGCLLPLGLESAGLVPASWEVANGALVLRSTAFEIVGGSTVPILLAITFGIVAVTALLARAVSLAHDRAQRDLATQAWHLRQLLPG